MLEFARFLLENETKICDNISNVNVLEDDILEFQLYYTLKNRNI